MRKDYHPWHCRYRKWERLDPMCIVGVQVFLQVQILLSSSDQHHCHCFVVVLFVPSSSILLSTTSCCCLSSKCSSCCSLFDTVFGWNVVSHKGGGVDISRRVGFSYVLVVATNYESKKSSPYILFFAFI